MKSVGISVAILLGFTSNGFCETIAKSYSCVFDNDKKQINACSFNFPEPGQPEQACNVQFSDKTYGYCSVADGGFLGDQISCINKASIETGKLSAIARGLKDKNLSNDYRAAALAFAFNHGVFFVLQLTGMDGKQINMQCNTVYDSSQ